MIEQLGFKPRDPHKPDLTDTSDHYINLKDFRGDGGFQNLREILTKAKTEGRKLAVEARTFDVYSVLRSEANRSRDFSGLARSFGKMSSEFIEALDVSDLLTSSHSLLLKHSEAEKLLDGIIDSLSELGHDFQDSVARSKETRELLLKYARISEDDVPAIKLGKGRGVYFFDDLNEATRGLKSDRIGTVDESKLDELRRKTDQVKIAEEELLGSPSLLPFIGLEITEATASGAIGALLSDFASFLNAYSKPIREFAQAVLPQVPVAAIGFAFLLYIRRKERKEHDPRVILLELVTVWNSLSGAKKEAIGECYDAAADSERGTMKEILDNVSGVAIEELKARLEKLASQFEILEKRVEIVEQLLQSSYGPATRITAENMIAELRLKSPGTAPVFSHSVDMKIQFIKESLRDKKSVVILGEGGIGKSTVFRRVCEELLSDNVSIFTFGFEGLTNQGIFVVDNLPARVTSLERLLQLPCPFLATARTHDWIVLSRGRGRTVEVSLMKDDFERAVRIQILRNIFDSKKIAYEENALEIAVDKSQGYLPEYLNDLATYALTKKARIFDNSFAESVPPAAYLLIAEILAGVRNELCLAMMYSVALTFGGRLHEIQVRELEKRLSGFVAWSSSTEISMDDELRSLVYEEDQTIHLNHDLWNDLLLTDWHNLGLSLSEPKSLEYVRSIKLGGCLADSIRLSKKELPKLNAATASKAALVIFENNLLEVILGLSDWLSSWKPGGKIAVISGERGSGKSTAIHLVANRFDRGLVIANFTNDMGKLLARGVYPKEKALVVFEGYYLEPLHPTSELWNSLLIEYAAMGFRPPIVVECTNMSGSNASALEALQENFVLLHVQRIDSEVFRYAFPELVEWVEKEHESAFSPKTYRDVLKARRRQERKRLELT